MSEPTILLIKPKGISQRDRKALQNAGVIVVEVENPSDVKFVRAGVELSATGMLMCAIKAISGSDYSHQKFSKAICAALEAASPPPQPEAEQ